MTAAALVLPDKAVFNFFTATNLLAANPANFKLALVGAGYAPAQGTDELWSVASPYEIAAGGGYVAGGVALPNVTLSLAGGKTKFASDAAVFNATGAGFPAWRRGVIYYNGTLNGKVNPIIGHFLGDGTGVDVPATTTGNTPLTINCPANGWVASA